MYKFQKNIDIQPKRTWVEEHIPHVFLLTHFWACLISVAMESSSCCLTRMLQVFVQCHQESATGWGMGIWQVIFRTLPHFLGLWFKSYFVSLFIITVILVYFWGLQRNNSRGRLGVIPWCRKTFSTLKTPQKRENNGERRRNHLSLGPITPR